MAQTASGGGSLLTAPFEFESDQPPVECATRLDRLAKPHEGHERTSRSVTIHQIEDTAYRFDLRLVRHNRGLDATSAQAVGTIAPGGDGTLVRAELKFGGAYLASIAAAAIIALSILVNVLSSRAVLAGLVLLVIALAIVAYLIRTLITDRASLSRLMERALAGDHD